MAHWRADLSEIADRMVLNWLQPKMPRLRFRFILIVTLFVAPQELRAEKSTQRDYYSIYGSTADELSQEMAQKGPQGFSAYTESSFRYNYRTAATARGCRISSVDIDYTLTYTMPRWENRSAAEPELVERWELFYGALSQHEKNHGAIADQMYSKLQGRFSQLGVRPSCGEFGALLQQERDVLRAEASAKHAAYDSTSRHGMVEGASHAVLFSQNSGAVEEDILASSFIEQYWLWMLLGVFAVVRLIRR